MRRKTWSINDRAIMRSLPWNYGDYCSWCNIPIPGGIEIDHIVELWQGGPHAPFNTMQVCSSCHKGKTVKPDDVAAVDWRLFQIDVALTGQHYRSPRKPDLLAGLITRVVNYGAYKELRMDSQLALTMFGGLV